ncbi:MAG: AAA family ATPase [Candidatus Thiodiazotropha sp. (ex Codakia rugifera)]|nr:AAA family ATPase [Candidatus Thiodiazotropha sp. (ex Codakia rugifera)]
MFESYYELNANPFRLSADEQFRFAHKNYIKAWSYLRYALDQGEGFVMITGQPGSGKTTLIRDILSELDESKVLAINLVTNQLQAEELLRKVALEYGLHAETYNKATLLTRIEAFVTSQYQAGRRAIIVIDEAQNLTLNGLEELRLLSNLQAGSHPLFQIFLIGQDELRNVILGPAMEQIRQRLIATCQIESMNVQQTEGYIEHRLGIVGWHDDPKLDPAIFPLIHYLTNGIPRKINHVASRLLLYGALEEKHTFSEEDVWIVAEELFDEERLSFTPGESFAAFKSKYGDVQAKLTESLEKEDLETDLPSLQDDNEDTDSGETPAKDAEQDVDSEPDLQQLPSIDSESDLQQLPPIDSEPDLQTQPPIDDGELAILIEEQASDGEKEIALNGQTPGHIEDEITERFTSPAGKLFLDDEAQKALTSRILHENRTVADELMAEATISSENESDSKIISEVSPKTWINDQEASEEYSHHKTEDILNLPSMKAEKRKHDIDEKGGLINTAETVEVDELFADGIGKSLRHIFFFVLVGLFILALFILQPAQLQTAWDKVASMVRGVFNQQTVEPHTTDEAVKVLGDAEEEGDAQIEDDAQVQSDAQDNTEPAEDTAILNKPVVTDEKTTDQEPTEDVTKPGSIADAGEVVSPEQDDPPVAVNETPTKPENDQSAVTDDSIEKASKDYIATQSTYQQVEVDESLQDQSGDLDIERKFQIYFEFDNTEIPEQFNNMLNDLFIVLSLNKQSTVRISGYTDASGEPLYNMRLSIDRAQAVSRYFTERGIPLERIRVEGRGPIPKLSDEENEALEKRLGNRRVEIILQENKE